MPDTLDYPKLSEILAESLDVEGEVFDKAYEFRGHELWDSMAALTMIALIDEAFGVVLSASEFRDAKTLEQLRNLIASKK